MKSFQIIVLILSMVGSSIVNVALADQYVHGYQKSNGTVVQPYYRSSPNNTPDDNYSTKGNTNPYTGREGTVDPYHNSNNSSNYNHSEMKQHPCGNVDC